MKITIIYDNTAFKDGLEADHGFSALIESENNPNILFDTGRGGMILLNNMEELGIDPKSVDEIFISHAHTDHTGGLDELLRINSKIKVFIPPSFQELENRATVVTGPTKIHKNMFSTGELDGIEQVLGLITVRGVVLVTGCAHPHMDIILNAARKFGNIYGIVGGLHDFSNFELFQDLAFVCPTHCTQKKEELKKTYPQKYVEGGAGRIINL